MPDRFSALFPPASNRERATRPTYEELERRVEVLEHFNRELEKVNERLAKFQPPAPIYLTVTPERMEEIKKELAHE